MTSASLISSASLIYVQVVANLILMVWIWNDEKDMG